MGFFIGIAGFDLLLGLVPFERIPGVTWDVQHAVLIGSKVDLLAEVALVPGLVIVVGPAAIHASLNAGALPSPVLATAPTYAMFVFTVPGPVSGVIIPFADVVFAPLWAAIHVLPNTVAYGTTGFLSGWVCIGSIGRSPDTPIPVGWLDLHVPLIRV